MDFHAVQFEATEPGVLALSFTAGCDSGGKEEDMFDDSTMQGIAKFNEHISQLQLTIE
jgi:hypothetical protein